MNYRLPTIWLVACFFTTVGYSQPTFYFDPELQTVDSGEIAKVDLKTQDFTDLLVVEFRVNWDPNVVTIDLDDPFSDFHPLLELDVSAFTVDNEEGYFTFQWVVGGVSDPCPPNLGVTIEDYKTLFSINFIGIQGNTYVAIDTEIDQPYVTRVNACPIDISCLCNVNQAFIGVNFPPLITEFPSQTVQEGEYFCVDLAVDAFQEVVSMQFTTSWDPAVLQFESAIGLSLPGWSSGSFFAQPMEGTLSVSWYVTPPLSSYTLPDGTTIVQLCFTAIGNCGEESQISINSNVTPIEVTTLASDGQDVGIVSQGGQVSIWCNDPDGLNLILEDKQVCSGSDFCVDLTVENFVDLVECGFSLAWDPNRLQYLETTNLNSSLDFLTSGTIDDQLADEGNWTFLWEDITCLGADLNDGEILASLCFVEVGDTEVNTAILIQEFPQAISVGNQCNDPGNLALNPFNGLVEIIDPAVGAVEITGVSTICVGETTILQVDNPIPGAQYFWDLGPDATPATFSGTEVEVQWDIYGTKTVMLTVDNGDCDLLAEWETQVINSPVFCDLPTIAVDMSPVISGNKKVESRYASLSSWPNPTAGGFQLIWSKDQVSPMGVRLVDLQGRILEERFANLQESWSLQGYPRGVYYLHCYWPDGSWENITIIKE